MRVLHNYQPPRGNRSKAKRKRRITQGIIGAAAASLIGALSFGSPNQPTPTPSARPATHVAMVKHSATKPKTTPTPTPVPTYTAAEMEKKLQPHFQVVGSGRDPKLPEITTNTIAWQLNRIHPDVAGHATTITKICKQYGVDPAYLVAKWNAESNCGKKGIAVKTKSIGNIRYTKPTAGSVPYTNYKGFRSYRTYQDAIEDFCRLTAQYDRQHQLNTLEQITRRWTPASENDTNRHQGLILSLMRRIYRHEIEKK